MDQSLNELFSFILLSEKVALNEKKMCREVKEKIEVVRLRLERQSEAKRECIQKIERLTDGLFQSMLGTKFMKSKEEFLTKKLITVQNEISSDTEKLENLNVSYEESSKAFMSLVQEFSKNYGLSSNGRDTRDSQARTLIKSLGNTVASLSDEFQDLQKRNEELSDVVSQLQKITELKKSMEMQIKECMNQIEVEEYEILKLQTQHHQFETLPEIDESFLSLNNELQQYQTMVLEKTAKDLQTELNQLLRSVKQKEAQKLKQQYRQWQRQRQQMMQQEEQNHILEMPDKPVNNRKLCFEGK